MVFCNLYIYIYGVRQLSLTDAYTLKVYGDNESSTVIKWL